MHRTGAWGRRGTAALQWVLALAGIALVFLSSGEARHWILELAATVCVVGGFIAAPVLTITAWIGMMAPNFFWLHRVSTILFWIAVVWLGLALIGAHIHYSREQMVNGRVKE